MYCSSEAGKGWKWGDSCYHVVTKKESWKNAEKHCKNFYNGHLVSILDKLEDVFLDYISANKEEELWIGIQIQVSNIFILFQENVSSFFCGNFLICQNDSCIKCAKIKY